MSAEYEFSRGERVVICCRNSREQVPGVVAYIGHTKHVVIIPDKRGRTRLENVSVHDLGLRHSGYLAFDWLADEVLSRMP